MYCQVRRWSRLEERPVKRGAPKLQLTIYSLDALASARVSGFRVLGITGGARSSLSDSCPVATGLSRSRRRREGAQDVII